MKLNIEIDDELVREGLRVSGAKTEKELIHLALKELVENRRPLNLLDLEGRIEFDEGYGYKDLRRGS